MLNRMDAGGNNSPICRYVPIWLAQEIASSPARQRWMLLVWLYYLRFLPG
jgi:hypothetical protein